MAPTVGDVRGDGSPDLVLSAGRGGGPQVLVVDGQKLSQVAANGQIDDAALINRFFAFDPAFTGGVNVATGPVLADGSLALLVAAGAGGGPQVRGFNGATAEVLYTLWAFDPNFTGGVTLTTGNLFGDGRMQIVAAAGPGGGPARCAMPVMTRS